MCGVCLLDKVSVLVYYMSCVYLSLTKNLTLYLLNNLGNTTWERSGILYRILQGIKSLAGTGPDNGHHCLSTNCHKELSPNFVADFSKPLPDFVFSAFRK